MLIYPIADPPGTAQDSDLELFAYDVIMKAGEAHGA
jgi:hypothetical protein